MENSSQIGTLIIIGTGLILGLVLIFLAVFYQTNVLRIKRKEAELLLKTSLQSEKEERKRIAADIHDGVSGDLNAVRNFLAILIHSEKDEAKKEMFNEISIGVNAALENTRLVSYKLMPPLLEQKGFITAVNDYIYRINKNNKIKFIFDHSQFYFEIPQNTAYELLRIIQEFTSNMMKYGNISECTLKIEELQSAIRLQIEDNGTPYNFKELYMKSKGTGLKNISSRIKILEADFQQLDCINGNKFVILVKK